MANYADSRWISQQPNTVRRIEYVVTKLAVAVMSESAQTAGHAARVAFATKVLAGQVDYDRVAIAALTSNAVSGGNVNAAPNFGFTDAELETAVTSVFNALAGIAT